ncbi:hypothetical protein DFH08DRAFT_807210 [Mycena albidolilacea]|uniref:Uncharacterized protein n=1 Tax=Mycena albidolilacea TaxID=1033008 RepID=A0AAD7EUY9_9AGAR|nr:hypothetical protein DFH08DRAFT_807210 [Mycena albidolilacea]
MWFLWARSAMLDLIIKGNFEAEDLIKPEDLLRHVADDNSCWLLVQVRSLSKPNLRCKEEGEPRKTSKCRQTLPLPGPLKTILVIHLYLTVPVPRSDNSVESQLFLHNVLPVPEKRKEGPENPTGNESGAYPARMTWLLQPPTLWRAGVHELDGEQVKLQGYKLYVVGDLPPPRPPSAAPAHQYHIPGHPPHLQLGCRGGGDKENGSKNEVPSCCVAQNESGEGVQTGRTLTMRRD